MAKLICWLFGHKIMFGPVVGADWYDMGCTRCLLARTVVAGSLRRAGLREEALDYVAPQPQLETEI